jgi:hypothetical protein
MTARNIVVSIMQPSASPSLLHLMLSSDFPSDLSLLMTRSLSYEVLTGCAWRVAEQCWGARKCGPPFTHVRRDALADTANFGSP